MSSKNPQYGLQFGIRAGTIIQQHVVFAGSSMATQAPLGLAIPLQVEFGPKFETEYGTLFADGSMSVKQACTPLFYMNTTYVRTGTSGTAEMRVRVLIDGVQFGGDGSNSFTSKDDSLTKSTAFAIYLEPGQLLTVEIMRATIGADDGFLKAFSNPPFDGTPSASIVCYLPHV